MCALFLRSFIRSFIRVIDGRLSPDRPRIARGLGIDLDVGLRPAARRPGRSVRPLFGDGSLRDLLGGRSRLKSPYQGLKPGDFRLSGLQIRLGGSLLPFQPGGLALGGPQTERHADLPDEAETTCGQGADRRSENHYHGRRRLLLPSHETDRNGLRVLDGENGHKDGE